jgi:transcriptional regulator with XRE-family HTH domain
MLTIVSPTPVWTTADIAKWIKAARKERGWHQTDLASRANVSRSVIQKLEAGRGTTVNLDTVMRLLRTLSLDLTIEPRSAEYRELSEKLDADA